MSPETQESSIVSNHVLSTDKSHNANEYNIKISDIDKTIEALKESGLDNYTIDQN